MKFKKNYEGFVQEMLAYDFLNPIVAYEGEWLLIESLNRLNIYEKDQNMLYLNSKRDKNGQNKFEELLRHTFYNGISIERIKEFDILISPYTL